MSASEETLAQPQIDLDRLDYPSDGLSLKHLRGLFPEEFRGYRVRESSFLGPSDHGIELDTMLNFERLLAKRAFNQTLERPEGNDSFTPSQEVREHLQELYKQFMLAEGLYHAQQLIRDLERRATEQALEMRGRQH